VLSTRELLKIEGGEVGGKGGKVVGLEGFVGELSDNIGEREGEVERGGDGKVGKTFSRGTHGEVEESFNIEASPRYNLIFGGTDCLLLRLPFPLEFVLLRDLFERREER